MKQQTDSQNSVVFIGLGSNLGDGSATLQNAWSTLGEKAGVSLKQLSSPYSSAPVGMESRNWFTNAVGRIITSLEPGHLLDLLLEVEESFGRRRDADAEGYQDRTLDLDLIYYGSCVMKSAHLVLPHPLRDTRLFVLEPLAEIAGDFIDPEDGLSPAEKLAHLYRQIETGEVERQEITRNEW